MCRFSYLKAYWQGGSWEPGALYSSASDGLHKSLGIISSQPFFLQLRRFLSLLSLSPSLTHLAVFSFSRRKERARESQIFESLLFEQICCKRTERLLQLFKSLSQALEAKGVLKFRKVPHILRRPQGGLGQHLLPGPASISTAKI